MLLLKWIFFQPLIYSASRLDHKRKCDGWTSLSIKGHSTYCWTLYAYFNHPLTSLSEEVHSANNFLNYVFHNIKKANTTALKRRLMAFI